MNFASTEPPFLFRQGARPLLISMPHVGTHIPTALAARLTEKACGVPDTDWHLDRLYDFADALGASVLVATHSRYVIDLNRPPDGRSLYPGQSVTGLCPIDAFDDTPLYRDVHDQPTQAEVAARREALWQPYHAQLQAELARLKARHGAVALWDAHSIRSVVPRFFEGRLPDLNLGTADSLSCDSALAARLLSTASQAGGYTAVLNGRFKGGHITRAYGNPAQGVHAVQLEMAQCTYMQESPPFDYLPKRASQVKTVVAALLQVMIDFVESGSRHK